MSDLVSIIIPTFNRANLLAETLDSVLQQTHTNWECIIVDDGSTDNISDIIEKYVSTDSRFRFYKRPSDRPKGANACRNYGFEMSKGDFINWFDSDDIMSLHHIEEHLRVHATTHVDATISLASVFTHSPDMTVRMWSAIAPREDVVSEMIAGVISWPINNVIWRRKSLPVCPFSENLSSSQEWTFHLSQLLREISYTIIDEITCYVRDHHQRIGKDLSESKMFSMFKSRAHLLSLLHEKNQLTLARELSLLKVMFLALRLSILYKHGGVFDKIFEYLKHYAKQSHYYILITKVLYFSVPVYKLTRRGERLFYTKM